MTAQLKQDSKYPYVNDDELDKPVIPYIWNRIYGGCQNGTVYGNTFMDFNGGYIVYNMFGGGWGNVDSLTVNGVKIVNPDGITSADVTCNTNIIMRNAEAKVNSPSVLVQVVTTALEMMKILLWMSISHIGILTVLLCSMVLTQMQRENLFL